MIMVDGNENFHWSSSTSLVAWNEKIQLFTSSHFYPFFFSSSFKPWHWILNGWRAGSSRHTMKSFHLNTWQPVFATDTIEVETNTKRSLRIKVLTEWTLTFAFKPFDGCLAIKFDNFSLCHILKFSKVGFKFDSYI